MGIYWEALEESRPVPVMLVTASEYQTGLASLVGIAEGLVSLFSLRQAQGPIAGEVILSCDG